LRWLLLLRLPLLRLLLLLQLLLLLEVRRGCCGLLQLLKISMRTY